MKQMENRGNAMRVSALPSQKKGGSTLSRYPVFLVFMMLILSTAWTSVHSYQIAEREINADLRQALTATKAENPCDWFTADTIRQFRSHIVSPELRQDAQLAFLLSDDGRLHVHGYVSYSSMQIWRMSDQRMSWALAVMALVSLGFLLRRSRMSPLSGDAPNTPRLTPMQEQLVGLLMSAPEGRMSKQELCQTLWPGKPDASETLYTLVRRTKQALEAEGRVRIASERGRSYRIEVI